MCVCKTVPARAFSALTTQHALPAVSLASLRPLHDPCAFAFGGWVLGRSLYLGQQLLDVQIEFD